jgi:hypothetical protein
MLLQGRGGQILLRLGMYFGGLLLDKLSGRDSVTQVQLRASQLR